MLQRKLRNQEEHEEVDFLIQKKQKLNDGDGPEESILSNPSAEAGLCQSKERKRSSQNKYQDKGGLVMIIKFGTTVNLENVFHYLETHSNIYKHLTYIHHGTFIFRRCAVIRDVKNGRHFYAEDYFRKQQVFNTFQFFIFK